jgi:hypothetical protein
MTEGGFSRTMPAVLLLTHSLHRVNLGLQPVPTGPLYQYTTYVYIYKEYHSVYMSPRRNWDSPTPSLASKCAPPPGTKGGGVTLACG